MEKKKNSSAETKSEKSGIQLKLRKPKFKIPDNRLSTLIIRELANYFSSPVAYIVLILFVIVLSVLLFGLGKFSQYGSADLTQMFSFVSLAFIIIVPALTMGSISREKQTGTLEYILTQPISEIEFILAKFLSYAILVFVMLTLTLPITVLIASFSGLDFGQALMQYFGAFMLGLCFVSVGIAVSALFKSEIASFLTSLVISAFLIIIGTGILSFLPGSINNLLEKFSLLSHYQSMSRGVLDLRDLLYFVAFIFVFISIAYYLLIKDKFPKKHEHLKNVKIATLILIVISVLVGFIGQIIPGRIDFTSNARYTLSEATAIIVNNIKDPINITFYASSNLPIDFQGELRNVSDTLRDYATASNGKITITEKQPDKDDATKTEAEAAGVNPIKFDVSTNSSAQVVIGYFGVTFKYLDKTDTLNLTSETVADLEYNITKKIKKLTGQNQKKIAFVNNNVDHARDADYTALNAELLDLYSVTDLTLNKENATIPSDISAIIIPSPSQKFDDEALASLMNYYQNGGGIFLMSEPYIIDQEQAASENTASLRDFFKDNGVVVNQNMAYDLKNNNIIALQDSGLPLVYNFPEWMITSATKENISILKDVSNMSVLWASDINIDTSKANGAKIYKLLETSQYANIQVGDGVNVSFDQNWEQRSTDKVLTMAAAIENAKGGRAVVIGDSDFIADNILNALSQRQEQHKLSIGFALNALSWLSKDDNIGGIKSKSRTATALNLIDWQASLLVGSSVVVPFIALSAIAGLKFYNRRKLNGKVFED